MPIGFQASPFGARLTVQRAKHEPCAMRLVNRLELCERLVAKTYGYYCGSEESNQIEGTVSVGRINVLGRFQLNVRRHVREDCPQN